MYVCMYIYIYIYTHRYIRLHEILTNNETYNDVGNITEAVKKTAIETLNIKPSKGKQTRL